MAEKAANPLLSVPAAGELNVDVAVSTCRRGTPSVSAPRCRLSYKAISSSHKRRLEFYSCYNMFQKS